MAILPETSTPSQMTKFTKDVWLQSTSWFCLIYNLQYFFFVDKFLITEYVNSITQGLFIVAY